MGEFSQTLPSEKVLYRSLLHRFSRYGYGSCFSVLLASIGWAAVYYPNLAKWPYVAAAVALATFLCLTAIIPLWTLKIAVTTNGVVVQRGWIAQTNQEMELRNVEEVNVDQSFFGRLFGYGTIKIRGTGVINSIVLQQIPRPYDLRRAIELAIQRQQSASADAKLQV